MAVVLCAMCALTSCEDFLNTVPLNEIVLENFWETEEEVNSVVMSCYSRMAQGDFLTRLILWGELRSDNVGKHLYHVVSDPYSYGPLEKSAMKLLKFTALIESMAELLDTGITLPEFYDELLQRSG